MACLLRSPSRWSCLLVGLALGGNPSSARAEDLPYPAGSSSHAIEGLQTELVLPKDLSAEKRGSLVVILHGAGGTATGMAGTLASWAQHGYVVCAPKSVGQVWEAHDLEKVVKIAQHLLKVLPLDPARVHTVGFSNGGWNLPRIAFDETLKPLSATWVAAGFRGGAVPEWAGKMGALALAGSNDGNVDAARATVKALSGKVRSVEVREQPGLGHEWPDKLAPYLLWWMGVQEGRFVPGADLNFDWSADLDAALAALAGKKKGGVLVYVFDATDGEKPEAKALQNETFFDPEVRRLGAQLSAVKLDRTAAGPVLERLGVTATPYVAVLDAKGALKHAFTGKFKASALAKALRSVAPEPRAER